MSEDKLCECGCGGVPMAGRFLRGHHRRLGPSPELRFWSKVDRTGDCWLWLAAVSHNGYGRFYVAGANHAAHRWAYEQLVGPIPEGMQIDHLCRIRRCVNPDHLEPVTCRENIRRGESAKRKLTDAQVREVRSSASDPKTLASLYGVSVPLIYNIKAGRRRAEA